MPQLDKEFVHPCQDPDFQAILSTVMEGQSDQGVIHLEKAIDDATYAIEVSKINGNSYNLTALRLGKNAVSMKYNSQEEAKKADPKRLIPSEVLTELLKTGAPITHVMFKEYSAEAGHGRTSGS
jgi:hypothetical protein